MLDLTTSPSNAMTISFLRNVSALERNFLDDPIHHLEAKAVKDVEGLLAPFSSAILVKDLIYFQHVCGSRT